MTMTVSGALFLDVREAHDAEALAFGVPGRLNIPLRQLPLRMRELPLDRDLIVVCLDGKQSATAVQMLNANGLMHALPMRGGLLLWMQKGYPVTGQRHATPVPNTDDGLSPVAGDHP